MSKRPIAIIVILLALGVGARAQENVGVIRQPQTIAPSIDIPGGQGSTCGRAARADEINKLVQQVRGKFNGGGLSAFDATMAGIARDPCPRSRASAYLIHLIANNGWTIGR